jgi:penicillin-binding protein 2
MNMHRAIAKSCNTYFYAMGRRVGIDAITAMGERLGFGQKFDLPVVSQSYGTMPGDAWKAKKYKQEWTQADTLNTSIGQGYVIVNPLQLAVMSARIASGRAVEPRLVGIGNKPAPFLPFPKEHFDAVRGGMWEVVNGNGTAGRSKLPFPTSRWAERPAPRRCAGSPAASAGRAAPGNIAITACSCASHRLTIRATPPRS